MASWTRRCRWRSTNDPRPGGATPAWRRALDLYPADLLDGPGARAYPWLDRPTEDGRLPLRQRYREQRLRASLRLARLLARSGQAARAVPLFEELLQREPLLEDVVRDLFRCYAELEDLPGLLAAERRLRQALHVAGLAEGASTPSAPLQPQPATLALFAELRQRLELRASALPA